MIKNNDSIVIKKVGNGFMVIPSNSCVNDYEITVFQNKGIPVGSDGGSSKTLLEFISEHFTSEEE